MAKKNCFGKENKAPENTEKDPGCQIPDEVIQPNAFSL